MAELYWCCREGESYRWLELLGKRGIEARLAGTVNRQSLIVITDPDESVLRTTFSLLAHEEIRSAALVAKLLPPNDLWLATEWWGRIVVEEAELGRVEGLRAWLGSAGSYPQRDLEIFKPREAAGLELGEDGLEPIDAREVAADDVREHPERYYGDLADPAVGGANVLFAAGLEAAMERGLPANRVLVGPPETFGFRRDTNNESVVAWRRQKVIEVEAIGFSLGSRKEISQLLGPYVDEAKLSELVAPVESWMTEGFSYGVAMVLKGLKDPPVVIPTGSVYQQPKMGATVQNLSVGRSANPIVGLGAAVPMVLPAYCLNRTFAPPSGPVVPTPLLHSAAGGSQQAVWRGIQRRYRGRP